MPSKDKSVNKRARDKWYAANAEKQMARQRERRRELQAWFQEYKRGLTCSQCGITFKKAPECCDFHHTPIPAKHKGMIRLGIQTSRKALLKELTKCIPVCANCHRKIHVLGLLV